MANNDKEILLKINLEQDKALKDLVALKDRIATLKEEQKQLSTVTEEGKAQYAAYQAQITNLTKESRSLENAVAQTAGTFNFESGSIAANRAELSKLTAEYKNLANPTAEQAKRIKDLSEKLKEQEKAIGQTYRNVGNYTESIKEALLAVDALKQKESALREEQSKVDKTTVEGKRTYAAYGAEIEKVAEQVKKQEQALGVATKSHAGFSDVIEKSGLSNTVLGQQLQQGAEGFQKLKGGIDIAKGGFVTLRGAIAATGIGLLLLAFTSLVAFFKQTDTGATILEGIFKGLGAVVNVLSKGLISLGQTIYNDVTNPKEAIMALGNAIQENLINRVKAFAVIWNAIKSGNLEELANGMTQLGTGITDASTKARNFVQDVKDLATETAAAAREGFNLAAAFDSLADRQRDYSVAAAQADKQVEQLLIRLKNKNLTEKESLGIAEEIAEIESKNFEQRKAYAEEYLQLVVRENKLAAARGELQDEEAQKEVDARLAVIALEKESAILNEKLQNRVDSIREESENKRQQQFEKEKRRQEELQKIADEAYQKEIDRIKGQDKAYSDLQQFKLDQEVKGIGERQRAVEKEYQRSLEDQDLSQSEREELAESYNEKIKTLIDERVNAEVIAEGQKMAALIEQGGLVGDAAVLAAAQKNARINEIQAKAEEEKLAKVEESEDKKQKAIKFTQKVEQEASLAKFGYVADMVGSVASLLDEQSDEYKALASAQALIETFLGAQRAYTSTAAIPVVGAALAPLAAGAAVVAGLANVAKINGVKLKDGEIDLKGPGTETSDSIPARLSKGESVMTAKETKMFKPQLIQMRKIARGQMPIKESSSILSPEPVRMIRGPIPSPSRFANGVIGLNTFPSYSLDGGLSARHLSQSVNSEARNRDNLRSDLIAAVKELPTPVVPVKEITKALDYKAKVEQKTNQ